MPRTPVLRRIAPPGQSGVALSLCAPLGHPVGVWTLDSSNSPELINAIRAHGRIPASGEVLQVGEGWRTLVTECHERLQQAFPEYELVAVKQKYGLLEFQAFPRSKCQYSSDEYAALREITKEISERSETVCEWCGSTGGLRDGREWVLTLCDACDRRFPDPPYPLYGSP
jgi:hypothetical protein